MSDEKVHEGQLVTQTGAAYPMVPDAGVAQLDLKGGAVVAQASELAVSASAAQARAMAEARFVVAQARPRNVGNFRARLLGECARPGFARVSRYALPRGDKEVTGWTIRFVEAALRVWGNVESQVVILAEDVEKLILGITVVDLETNATYSTQRRVAKTVERRKVRQGQLALAERTNSQGNKVFIVEATADELAAAVNSAASREIRTNGLRLLPGDVLEEAESLVYRVKLDADAKDPAAARKQVEDAFRGLNILPNALTEFLGHALEQASPAELTELRSVYATVREGAASWAELVELRNAEREARRAQTALDDVDLKKVESFARTRAKKFDGAITWQEVADGAAAEFAEGVIDRTAVPKAKLPQYLMAIPKWEPPTGGGAPAEQGAAPKASDAKDAKK